MNESTQGKAKEAQWPQSSKRNPHIGKASMCLFTDWAGNFAHGFEIQKGVLFLSEVLGQYTAMGSEKASLCNVFFSCLLTGFVIYLHPFAILLITLVTVCVLQGLPTGCQRDMTSTGVYMQLLLAVKDYKISWYLIICHSWIMGERGGGVSFLGVCIEFSWCILPDNILLI